MGRKLTTYDGKLPKIGLTPDRQRFAVYLAAGKSPQQAFALTWPKRAANLPPESIRRSALEMARHEAVQQYMRAAQAAGLSRHLPTIEEHAAELARLRELAAAKEQYGAAVSAEFRRGQIGGHYLGKTEDRSPDTASLAAALQALGLGALADRLAQIRPGDNAKLIEPETQTED